MNIFVTGATGFIGKNFIKHALKIKKNKIFALTRKKNKRSISNLTWIRGGLDKKFSKYFKKTDVLVHFAAAGVKNNNLNPQEIYKTNFVDSLKLVKNLIFFGCKKFVIISSSSEYGNNLKKKRFLSKNTSRQPNTFYAHSKKIFTDSIKELSKKTKCKFRIMRLFPVYGKGEQSYRLYPSLKKAAISGKNFKINNPNEVRDFTDVNFASKVILQSVNFKKNSKNFEVFHVSSNNSTTVFAFAKTLWKKYNAKGVLTKKKNNKSTSGNVSDINSVWKLRE